MVLKPQDVMILMKIHLLRQRGLGWTYAGLAKELHMSASEVHEGVKRAQASRLIDMNRRVVRRKPFLEFLIHGVKYVYPPSTGGPTCGMPTCYAAPPTNSVITTAGHTPPPVWPTSRGTEHGYEFSPLCKSAPEAAADDKDIYELLVLVDCIRGGSIREVNYARELLTKRIIAIAMDSTND
jgi:hypothetical protein